MLPIVLPPAHAEKAPTRSESAPASWATRTAVDAAAALLPAIPADRDARYLTKLRHQLPGERWLVKIGPGGIQLRHELAPDSGSGWEPLDESDLIDGQRSLLDDGNPHTANQEGDWIDPFAEEPEPGRRILRVWSQRSRTNMVRTLAMIDWSAVYEIDGRRRAMVTLTYPGDWLAAAPNAATSWQHLDRFIKMWERSSMGKLSNIWKREFQRRGAPHYHLAAAVPDRVQWRCHRWCGRKTDDEGEFIPCENFPNSTPDGHDDTIRDFVARAWAHVVDTPSKQERAEGITHRLDPEEHRRHLLAGTAVDFAEGEKWIDPKRLAVYFTRHAAKGSASKEHQHVAPAGWDGPGRWWGVRRVEKLTHEVELSADDLLELRRLMRAWEKAQGAGTHDRPKRMRNVLVPRGPMTADGTIPRRWTSKPYRTASLGHSQGGFLVLNDGPSMAAEFARWLVGRNITRTRTEPLP